MNKWLADFPALCDKRTPKKPKDKKAIITDGDLIITEKMRAVIIARINNTYAKPNLGLVEIESEFMIFVRVTIDTITTAP